MIDLKESIYNLIKEKDNVSFPELTQEIEGFSGDLEMVFSGFDNVVLWSNISLNGYHAVTDLLEDKRIHFEPTQKAFNIVDSEYFYNAFKLPLATVGKKYKSPHFLPVVFRSSVN